MTTKNILIKNIPEDLLKNLGHLAVEKGVSRSEIIRQILEKEVETTSTSSSKKRTYGDLS